MNEKTSELHECEYGAIKWSDNATPDIQEVGNVMLTTPTGEEAFKKWQTAKTEVTIIMDRQREPTDRLAETVAETDDEQVAIMNEDKQYKAVTVTFFEKSINKNREKGSGKRFEGGSYEEILGAVGTHEVFHNEPKQIKLDEKVYPETDQNPGKNLPINAEVDFRKEYQEKHPEEKANTEKGMKMYEQRGYFGLKKK